MVMKFVKSHSPTKNHELWLEILTKQRAIAVIRSNNIKTALKMAHAVANGGMQLIEITWNSIQPREIVQYLRQELPDCLIGVGTILTTEDLTIAIDSGSQFVFTPHTNLSLIEQAKNAQIPIVSGALTPTEIITAYQAGSTAVKVFPIDAVGGINYLKALKGPINNIPLIPTGGVTIANAKDYIKAGALGVGLAGDLFPQTLINDGLWTKISDRSHDLLLSLHKV